MFVLCMGQATSQQKTRQRVSVLLNTLLLDLLFKLLLAARKEPISTLLSLLKKTANTSLRWPGWF